MDVDLVEVDNSIYEYHLQGNKILFKLMSSAVRVLFKYYYFLYFFIFSSSFHFVFLFYHHLIHVH
jgi:hypothetical protein